MFEFIDLNKYVSDFVYGDHISGIHNTI